MQIIDNENILTSGSSGSILTSETMTATTTTNCINPFYSYPTYAYSTCSCCNSNSKKMGEFDLHLDSAGNLRVIRNGKLLETFKAKEKSE